MAALARCSPAFAQTSYLSPDGRNRFPAVTIFCPSGSGVAPCSFGGGNGGGGNGTVSINLGGTSVSASNRLPVSDPALDSLIANGALNIGGSISVSALPPLILGAGANTVGAVSQAGAWSVNLAGGLPAGTNAVGSVSVSNLPATQSVTGTVGLLPGTIGAVTAAGTSGTTAQGVQGVANGVPLSVSGGVSQAGSWLVGVSSLPALPAGANTIGAVSITGTPTFNCNGCGGGAGGAVSQGVGSSGNAWWMQGLGSAGTPSGGVLSVQGVPSGAPVGVSGTLGLVAGSMGSVTAAGSAGSLAQAVQGIGGGVAMPISGSVAVSNLPAVQPVSATALPLPAGAAQDASVQSLKTALGVPMQQSGGSVAVASLPSLPAGSNAIGTVGLVFGSAGSVTGAGSVGSLAQAVQGIAGGVPQPVSGSVTIANLPVTQAVSAASWPLPAGAATQASEAAPLAPMAPAAATATNAIVVGCQAATTLPSFTAGQQGAVPCDTSGRLYVVTVPSANNVPGYLQAVTSGGASIYRAINAASSTMAANIKSGSGMVYGYEACNSGTQAAYLRLFALAAAPTVGTSTPTISKLLPAGACQTTMTDVGLMFAGGIGVDVTAGSLADGDTTALAAANQVTVGIYYK